MLKNKNKVAVIFNKPGVFPGFEDVISAHIQLPLQTAALLQEKGEDCLVITTKVHENQVLPTKFKQIKDNLTYFISDLNKQGNKSAALEGQVSGFKFTELFNYVIDVYRILKNSNITVLHVFGTKKFILLNIVFKVLRPKLKVIWSTEYKYSKLPIFFEFFLKLTVKSILTTTQYVKSTLLFHKNVFLVRPGVAREFKIDKKLVKNRVLFWRDPSPENGADIAYNIFKNLALEFKDIKFTFAVRPHWNSVVSVNDCEKYNIDYFEYPYSNNVTIDKLLSESVCVLFPFRELSTNPQLAVIETLNAGVPVLCSSVESNKEILAVVGLDYSLEDIEANYESKLREMLLSYKKSNQFDDIDLGNLSKVYDWQEYITGCQKAYQ